MAVKQIRKYKKTYVAPVVKKEEKPAPEKNKQKKTKENMDEKINKAEEIMQNMKDAGNVKVLKKDKGLIERTESSKIVLTEDNRQVLND